MDDIDKNLIQTLSDNARTPLTELARKLGVARTTVQSRIDRLEKTGTIRGYTLRMGYARRPMIRASVLIAFEPHSSGAVLLNYALTWFSLALIWLGMSGYFLYRSRNSKT